MRAGFGSGIATSRESLRYAQQLGATDIIPSTESIPSIDGTWALQDLVKLRLRIEEYGMSLTAIENVPISFYDHFMLNGPRRDEQIEKMIITISNMARAGIPIFGYHWMPSHVWRTPEVPIRGGALATAFDNEIARQMPDTHGRRYSEEEMWENLEYWLKIIIPVAEEEGIKIGIHPCDPPVDSLGGIPMLFNSYDNYPAATWQSSILPTTPSNFARGPFQRCMTRRVTIYLRIHQGDGRTRPHPVRAFPKREQAESGELSRGVHQYGPRRHVPRDEDVQRRRLQELLHRRPRAAHRGRLDVGPSRGAPLRTGISRP